MSGDVNAEAVCVQFMVHRSALIDAAAGIVGCRQRAEDVVQDAYLKVVGLADKVDILQPISYLYRVVRNLAIDRSRRAKREINTFVDMAVLASWTSESVTPETIVIQRQLLAKVGHALSTLPPRTQTAFSLHRFAGMSQRDVAKQLHISTTLVNFMIRDAVSHCKKSLQ